MSGRSGRITKAGEARSVPQSAEELSRVLDYLERLPDFAGVLVDEAQTWRETLARCGFTGDLIKAIPAMRAKYGDDSFPEALAEVTVLTEAIAGEWSRIKAAGFDIGPLISAAVDCGQRRERWCRTHAIDINAGATLEVLAAERRKQRVPFRKRNEGRDEFNKRRTADKERWYVEARRIAEGSNRRGASLENYVMKQLARRGIFKARRSIRRALAGNCQEQI